jgi:glycosyltransferase involved in cell wall biosynthesis
MVNTYDVRGGAARSALRIFHALRSQDVDVNLLVQNKSSDDPAIIGPESLIGKGAAALRPYADFAITFPWHKKRIPFFPAYLPGNFISKVKRIRPDIIHLNWISGGFIQLESLAELDIPIIWTLHDMWAFTGGCHYSHECVRYLENCGKCPILKSRRENDPSRWIFNRKKKTYPAIKELLFLTPSHWLAECARSSALLSGFPVKVFPNSLDTGVFYPEDRSKARAELALPSEKKIVLFGALDATRNRLKGFRELSTALDLIENKQDIELAVFGSAEKGSSTLQGYPVRYFGYVNDDNLLRHLYSSADVMVVPSIQEVFGQTATEAMACGTPVVAFGETGLADIVVHKTNGYLAEPFDPHDLARGISWCLEDDRRNNDLSKEAVETVKEKFDISSNIHHLISIYKEIIDK